LRVENKIRMLVKLVNRKKAKWRCSRSRSWRGVFLLFSFSI